MYCQVQIQLKSNSTEPSHFIEVQRILAESHISEQSHMDKGWIKYGHHSRQGLLCINVNVSLSILLVSFYWPLHSPHLQACKDFQPVPKCNYHCGSYVLLFVDVILAGLDSNTVSLSTEDILCQVVLDHGLCILCFIQYIILDEHSKQLEAGQYR